MATFRSVSQFYTETFQTVDEYLERGYEPVLEVTIQPGWHETKTPTFEIWRALAELYVVGVSPESGDVFLPGSPKRLKLSHIHCDAGVPQNEQEWWQIISAKQKKHDQLIAEKKLDEERRKQEMQAHWDEVRRVWPKRLNPHPKGWPLEAYVGCIGDRIAIGEIVRWWGMELYAVATEQGFAPLERESPEGLKQKENYVCQNEEFSIYYSA